MAQNPFGVFRMIKKIISGGQTGVDQSALDIAIKWNIPHGGWVPKGRLTEAGRLSQRYNMQEMPTESYAARTEQNVIDSDGTLILSHGPLSNGSRHTKTMAEKHNKPCLHIDLNGTDVINAARHAYNWIINLNIQTLNVAGTRASTDPSIYQTATHVLTNLLIMDLIEMKTPWPDQVSFKPGTIEKAVDSLVSGMSLRERCYIANMLESDLVYLDITLGALIRETYGLKSGNSALHNTLKNLLDRNGINDDDVAKVIINELWKKLHETHVLKIVKK
jgi:hypothetical protein